MKKLLSLVLAISLVLSTFVIAPVSADSATDLVDDFSTFGTDEWIGYEAYSSMRYGAYTNATVFGTFNNMLYGADWAGDVYLAYNGDFGGKMFETVFFVDDWVVNQQLALAYPNTGNIWGAYYELYQYYFADILEIYAGETYDSMSVIDADWVLGGVTPEGGRLALAVVVESLPANTNFVKVQLNDETWTRRIAQVKITDDKSDIDTYDKQPAQYDTPIETAPPTPTPTPTPEPTPTPDSTPDPSLVIDDPLDDWSKADSHSNIGIFSATAAVSSDFSPENQNLENPYVTNGARREGSSGEAYITYSLDNVSDIASTSLEAGVLYFYANGYAGGTDDDAALDYLNKSIEHLGPVFTESIDGVTYTEIEDISIKRYPAPWPGQSSHYAVFTVEGLSEGAQYVKLTLPSVENAEVTLYGWDPLVDYVKVTDKSLKAATTTVVVDNMDDESMLYSRSDNIWFYEANFAVSADIYPEHQNLENPYKSNMARRDGSGEEAHLIYELETTEGLTVAVDSFYCFGFGYAGCDSSLSALDHLNENLKYQELKFYESADNVTYTEVENVTLKKIPGPWGGQSMHYVGYTIKDLAADSVYLKIVVPEVQSVIDDGIWIDKWQPFIDKVTFTTKTAGVYTNTVFDPLNDVTIMSSKSNNIGIYEQGFVTSSDLYPEHCDLNNPYMTNVARRDGSKDEAYLIYEIEEYPEYTTVDVEAFYWYNGEYAGATAEDTALDCLNKNLQYEQLVIMESADGVNYTEVENVSLKKLPGPWKGQSQHYVKYTAKDLSADTAYVKIVVPSIQEAVDSGVELYAWATYLDSVALTTKVSTGSTTPSAQKLTVQNTIMSNMVLQANEPVTISGLAEKERTVTATLTDGTNAYTATTVATGKDEYSLTFEDTFEPSYTEYTLTLTDGVTTRTFANIVFGDVYYISGQSNMYWKLSNFWGANGDEDSSDDIQSADFPYLRVTRVGEDTAPEPTMDAYIQDSWYAVNSSNAGNTSAIGFYFGREMLETLDYPIGIVDTSWGGQAISPFLKNGAIYNNHIYPYKDFKFKGILWYQGESDNTWADGYASKHIKFIDHLRELFGENIPFALVQLANYTWDPLFVDIREAQLDTFKHYEETAVANGTENTVGIISIVDIIPQDAANIHPTGKYELAKRLALWADNVIYDKGTEYSGPIAKYAVGYEDRIEIKFDHIGTSLVAKDGTATVGGFTVYDADGNGTDVTGTVTAVDTITITLDTTDIVSVGYADKENNTTATLFNNAGFSAPGFTAIALIDESEIPEDEEVVYGDVNADSVINVNDVVLLVEYIGTMSAGGTLDATKFPGGTFPGGLASAKLTADDDINVNDAVLLVEYIGTMAAGGTLDATKFPNGTFPGAAN